MTATLDRFEFPRYLVDLFVQRRVTHCGFPQLNYPRPLNEKPGFESPRPLALITVKERIAPSTAQRRTRPVFSPAGSFSLSAEDMQSARHPRCGLTGRVVSAGELYQPALDHSIWSRAGFIPARCPRQPSSAITFSNEASCGASPSPTIASAMRSPSAIICTRWMSS
jgi:hypothetical protein